MASFDKLTSQTLWMDAVLVVVGFALPGVVRRLVESDGNTDLPDEAYGVASAAVIYVAASGRTANRAAAGSAAYAVVKLAERFDLVAPVEIRPSG